jgi:hypothetical protein
VVAVTPSRGRCQAGGLEQLQPQTRCATSPLMGEAGRGCLGAALRKGAGDETPYPSSALRAPSPARGEGRSVLVITPSRPPPSKGEVKGRWLSERVPHSRCSTSPLRGRLGGGVPEAATDPVKILPSSRYDLIIPPANLAPATSGDGKRAPRDSGCDRNEVPPGRYPLHPPKTRRSESLSKLRPAPHHPTAPLALIQRYGAIPSPRDNPPTILSQYFCRSENALPFQRLVMSGPNVDPLGQPARGEFS